MAQRAGVALSRISENAPISIARVDGAPFEEYFFTPVARKLEKHTVTAITDTVKSQLGFDTTLTDNGFLFSYPMALSEVQRKEFKYPSHDHFMSFLNGYDFSAIKAKHGENDLEAALVDLTPGQLAAKMAPGGIWSGHWTFKWPGGGETVLEDAGDLSPQEILDRLIKPTLETATQVHVIGIYRPDGPSAEITSLLEAQYPNTTIAWVSLADIAHGAAVVMHRQDTSYTQHMGAEYLSLPVGVALASGETVNAIVKDCMMPRTETVIFTTSKDNQTTATVRILKGTLPCDVVTIEGLTAKPKGAVRIQVVLEVGPSGSTVVTVEELGGTARKVTSIADPSLCTAEDVTAYEAETTTKQLPKSPNAEGVIGELPE
ncbi:hypothetical protein M408DRAFT_331218 [Serendipita vermifera MAFF 305830]|uniref:Uncharacterized protein n=1 Tax=Serendipita vermifera MAFF 305830 TaxID=933852 RepID=A0A0C3B1Q3_SERVB|nr:hypothetical protein M408DRAFT_331218 [Serendipita vermifera MAFF 305830]